MGCDNCADRTNYVPYIAYESTKSTMERTNRRLWILAIILVALLFGTNAAWVYYVSQWEMVSTTEITQENENGYNNFIGNDGDIYNGETNSEGNQNP